MVTSGRARAAKRIRSRTQSVNGSRPGPAGTHPLRPMLIPARSAADGSATSSSANTSPGSPTPCTLQALMASPSDRTLRSVDPRAAHSVWNDGAVKIEQMQAVVQDGYGGADVLSLRRIDVPEVGADEVLVRVHAAGVTRAAWHVMTGRPHLTRLMGYGVRRPKVPVPGLDLAGRVEAVGRDVTRFAVGDEVYGTGRGAWAEYAVAPEDQVAPKPADLPFEEAAAVPYGAGTALQALCERAEVTQGQQVLVIGASGAVGTFSVQLARALGAEVTGMAGPTSLDLVRSLGADHVLDHTSQEITADGRTYDLIIDIVGRRPFSVLRQALAPSGTAVMVGGEGGGPWTGGFFGRMARAALHSRLGKQRFLSLVAKDTADRLLVLNEHLETGAITPVIDRSHPLAEVREAFRHLESGPAHGVIVLTT